MNQLANFAVYSRQALTISGDGETISDQRRSLNPAFVEALMGWPTAWTGFDFAATAWFPWLQRMRSEFLRLGLITTDNESAPWNNRAISRLVSVKRQIGNRIPPPEPDGDNNGWK